MKAYDFIYSEKKLDEFGFQICSFGSKGLETLDNGSQISFNKVSSLNGLKHNIVSTLYEDCLEATIQICKNSCSGNAMEISPTEEREIMR